MWELTQLDPVEANRKLMDDLVRQTPLDTLHAVLRLLLEEKVSIRNLPLIMEASAEARLVSTQPELICEHVRQRLGFQLVAELKRDDGTVPLIQLAPEWEEAFASYQVETAGQGLDVALPPELFNRLAESMENAVTDTANAGQNAAIVTTCAADGFCERSCGHAGSPPRSCPSKKSVWMPDRPW